MTKCKQNEGMSHPDICHELTTGIHINTGKIPKKFFKPRALWTNIFEVLAWATKLKLMFLLAVSIFKLKALLWNLENSLWFSLDDFPPQYFSLLSHYARNLSLYYNLVFLERRKKQNTKTRLVVEIYYVLRNIRDVFVFHIYIVHPQRNPVLRIRLTRRLAARNSDLTHCNLQ